jgi:branched-subunit amino acid ABC-type transport system permease component
LDLSLLLTNLLYGVTIGSALILIASGLSLTFGVMGVLNFAHGGLCMLGAYFGYTLVQVTGNFWLAMILAPLIVAVIGILMESFTIRPLYGLNPLYQLLLTVGLAMIIANAVLLLGRGSAFDHPPRIFQRIYKLFWSLLPPLPLVCTSIQRDDSRDSMAYHKPE